jgi:hypothetical protein
VAPDGTVTTLIADLGEVRDVALGPDGELYAATPGRVWRIAPEEEDTARTEPVVTGSDPWAGEHPGTVLTVAGTEHAPFEEDPVRPFFPPPEALAAPRHTAVGNGTAGDPTVYVADPARHRVLGVDPDGADATMADAVKTALDGDTPYVVLVEKGTFADADVTPPASTGSS